MLVFMTGLIYLNGCKEAVKRAYAPDGRPAHQASLWIADDLVASTDWWAEFRISRDVDGVAVTEFRVPGPSDIWFPDINVPMSCVDLDDKLPKLKKKKQNGSEEEFDVDPDIAETIAEVTIRGGRIEPKRFKQIGLVQWTITNPSTLVITAVSKETAGDSRTITLETATAEVVFSNTHDLFALDEKGKDSHAGDHVDLFIKLSPESNVTVVSKKPSGSVGQLKTDNAILNLMRKTAHTEGDTPGCCCSDTKCPGGVLTTSS